MQKMKTTNVGGFEMRTLDLQARDSVLTRAGNWVMEYSIEIITVLGVILIAYMFGLLMQSAGQGVQAFSELLDEQQAQQEDAYQMEQVLNALVLQRQEENVHPITGAELPPYWTAPEATE